MNETYLVRVYRTDNREVWVTITKSSIEYHDRKESEDDVRSKIASRTPGTTIRRVLGKYTWNQMNELQEELYHPSRGWHIVVKGGR